MNQAERIEFAEQVGIIITPRQDDILCVFYEILCKENDERNMENAMLFEN